MRNVFFCAWATALSITGLASASVDLLFTGAGVGQTVTVTSPNVNGALFAGQIYITLSNSTGPNYDGNWIAYCADLSSQTVPAGVASYEYLPVASLPMNAPMGAVSAAAINDLYTFAAGTQNGLNADIAAAFQIAIWEVITDYAGGSSSIADISSGAFQCTDMTVATQGFLSLFLASIGNTVQSASLIGLGSEAYQDQIIEVGDVPGPGALAAGALGLLMARGRRRRA